MNNLIKNELTKIFKKKSIYITFIIIVLFMIFLNCMNLYARDISNSIINAVNSKQYYQAEIEKTNQNNPQDKEYLAFLKTQLQIMELKEKYGKDSWQAIVIEQKLTIQLNEMEALKSGVKENTGEIEKLEKLEKEYQDTIEKLEKDDWKYFAKLDLEKVTEEVNVQKQILEKATDKMEKQNIESIVKTLEIQEQVARWRVEKEIKYANNYLNQALTQYEYLSSDLSREKTGEEHTFAEKQQIEKTQKEIAEIKYSIENMQEIGRKDDTRGMIPTFFNNYGLFIIIIIIMVAGSIVSEEFNKGTIKLLLVRPYKRTKILLAKFIAVLIVMVITIIAMAIAQLLIGGVLFGWESLKLPATIYNFGTQTIETVSIIQYFGMQLLCNLPIFLLLGTLAFTISVVFMNTPVAIVIPLLGYMVSAMINQLVTMYNVTGLKYFVTLNWDLSSYIGGGVGTMEGLTMGISSLVCGVYFIVMMIISFIVFKNKNIKNV